jgi:hypothetical protein
VNLWMKRAIGAAALSGGLLALSAGAASAQDVSADVSANLGRPTSAQVRVCADGQVLSGLLGSCSGSGTRATVESGRSTGVRVRARVPRTAAADVSVGTRRSRPAASGQASTSRPRSTRVDADASATTSPRARADGSASLTRRTRPLLDLDATLGLAGVGLLGSSPFTLVGDPATDNLLPTGELSLDGLTGEAPAGIGVLDTGPIASGNQVGADVGDVSPSVPVTICGNGVGVLGGATATCTPAQPAAPGGSSTGSGGSGSTGASAGTGDATGDALLGSLASGNQVDAGIGDISPSVPVTVCGNSVGALGDASASCGTSRQAGGDGTAQPSGSGGTSTGTTGGNQAEVSVDDVSPSVPVTACGNSLGLLGDASAGCGTTSSGGIIAPPPGTTPDTTPGRTDTTGTDGTPGSTGTSGIPGTTGLTPGSGGSDGSATSLARLRPSVAGSGALPFTGAASDLLAVAALGLLIAGALVVRATRPAAATEGGDDR